MMIAYKFLSSGAIGLFSRHAWPTPTADAAGEWVRVDGELLPCLNGIHASAKTQLIDWLDDELWEIELADPILEADGALVAAGGRLIRRVDAWDEDCARALVRHCIDNTVALTASTLAEAGRQSEARALTASGSTAGAELNLLQLAQNLDDRQAIPLLFLDDLRRLERGGRPEHADDAPASDEGGPTPAALAANLSYVCAHITAQLAEQTSRGTYDESFASERRHQATWLAERLQLDR